MIYFLFSVSNIILTYVISQHFKFRLLSIADPLASTLRWVMLQHLHIPKTFNVGAHLNELFVVLL